MNELMEIIVPVAICAVLPIMIVWIVFRSATNRDNKRAAIIMKAIESSNGNLDIDRLADSLRDQRKSPRHLLNLRLLRGCMLTLVGIALTTWGIAGPSTEGDDSGTVVILGIVALAIGISYLIVYLTTRKQVDAAEAREAAAPAAPAAPAIADAAGE